MGSQSEAFLDGLGDEWLERNRADLGREPDLPMGFLKNMKPGTVLEIGCANGWRLKKLLDLGWKPYGIEPSLEARLEAQKLIGHHGFICEGTADVFEDFEGEIDVVLLGYCMSLTDPEDWPDIVGNVNSYLKMGGHLLIHDFDLADGEAIHTATVTPEEPYHPFTLHSVYWPNLWLGFPTYKVISCARESGTRNVCYLLKKDKHYATQG